MVWMLFALCIWSFTMGLAVASLSSQLQDFRQQVRQLGRDLAELGMETAHVARITEALARRLPTPTETGRLRRTQYMGRQGRPIEVHLARDRAWTAALDAMTPAGDPTDAPGPVLVWFEIRDLDNSDAEVVQSYDDPGAVVDAWNEHEGRKRFRNVRITEGPDFRELKEVRAY